MRDAVPPSARTFQRSHTPLFNGRSRLESRLDWKAIHRPSGDHEGESSSEECQVSCSTSPLTTSTTKMSRLPPLSLENASFRPSGDQQGFCSWAGSRVTRSAAPPSTGQTQRSPCQSNATRLPSGESAGWRIPRISTEGEAAPSMQRDNSAARRDIYLPPGDDKLRLYGCALKS